jgi:hypothetical protein
MFAGELGEDRDKGMQILAQNEFGAGLRVAEAGVRLE